MKNNIIYILILFLLVLCTFFEAHGFFIGRDSIADLRNEVMQQRALQQALYHDMQRIWHHSNIVIDGYNRVDPNEVAK